MPILHTVECPDGHAFETTVGSGYSVPCIYCGLPAEIRWATTTPRDATPIRPSERTVVYEHPVTGHVEYPGRADAPMPQRYRDWGYQRRELTSLHEVNKFERQHNVVNERAHYDRNGHSYDGSDCG